MAVVPVLFPDLKGSNIGDREPLAAIAATLENGANQFFMLPGKATKEDRRVRALLSGEGPLYWTMKVLGLIKPRDLAQANAFRF